jgi:hypothetical protein
MLRVLNGKRPRMVNILKLLDNCTLPSIKIYFLYIFYGNGDCVIVNYSGDLNFKNERIILSLDVCNMTESEKRIVKRKIEGFIRDLLKMDE